MSWSGYIPGDLVAAVQDPREARLPKWAQGELATLRRKLSEAEGHIRDMTGDIAETDTYVDSMRSGENRDYPLPPGSRVAYRLVDNARHGAYVRTWIHRDPWGGVRLHIQGDRSLLIRPSASNTFYVSPDD